MILIITQCFPSRVGGIESLVGNLSINLGKHEKVVVFADRHHILYDSVFDNQNKNRILVRRIGGIKFFRRRNKIKEIKLLVESQKVKLVIADSWKSLELVIDYLNLKQVPSVSLAHGNELLSKNQYKINRFKTTLNKVSTIIANSFFTKNLLESFILPDIPVRVVHPGASDFRKIQETVVDDIEGDPILLTLSRLEKRKGHIHIINCIKKILPQFPNIKYIIAGEGPEKKNFKKFSCQTSS